MGPLWIWMSASFWQSTFEKCPLFVAMLHRFSIFSHGSVEVLPSNLKGLCSTNNTTIFCKREQNWQQKNHTHAVAYKWIFWEVFSCDASGTRQQNILAKRFRICFYQKTCVVFSWPKSFRRVVNPVF